MDCSPRCCRAGLARAATCKLLLTEILLVPHCPGIGRALAEHSWRSQDDSRVTTALLEGTAGSKPCAACGGPCGGRGSVDDAFQAVGLQKEIETTALRLCFGS